uniref:WD repeat-containing protein 43 isoform X2 n=1 Tax=Myxine glutinosa TaxID=7769 RepID=UPI00358EF288
MAAHVVWPRPCAFSPGAAPYFAVASADGRLNVWEATSGSLRQEFVPSSHLSATCTCLAWAPIRKGSETPQRKKRKSETVERTAELDLLALGTATGAVLLYSVVRGKLHCKLTFTGHATAVTMLAFATHAPASSEALDGISGLYFISCAEDDRFVNVWQVRSGKQDICAALTLALPDAPLSLDLVRPEKRKSMLKVGVICKDGRLLLFQHTLNGKCKKPLAPDCTLQIATESGGEASPMALLAVVFCADPSCLFLAYGSPMRPVLEKMKADMSEPHICLVRDDPLLSNIQMKIATQKMKTPLVKDSKVLVPGLPGHTRRGVSMGKQKSQRGCKRKDTEDNVGVSGQEQSLEARLSSLEMCEPSPGRQDTTELTDFNVLLSQALESNDEPLLNKVLQMKQNSLVYSTVAQLPIQMVLPLIQVVTKRLQSHPRSALKMLRWIKTVCIVHASYLSSLPDLPQQFSTVYELMDSRLRNYQCLIRLQGKLHMMTQQLKTSELPVDSHHKQVAARLVFEEESSSSEDESTGKKHVQDEWEIDEDEEEQDVDSDVEEGDNELRSENAEDQMEDE